MGNETAAYGWGQRRALRYQVMDWPRLLPRVEREYTGARVSMRFLALVAAIGTFRSLVHMLARDVGARSIAGLDVAVEGGINIVPFSGNGEPASSSLLCCIG